MKKHRALSAVRTPDETVWSLRASDIYQDGENEPPKLTERAWQPFRRWTSSPQKTTVMVVALSLRASSKMQTTHDSAFPSPFPSQMAARLHTTRYGQRWQVETVNSMLKRLLGAALRARTYWSQCREIMLRALTLNLMIVALIELFYKAVRCLFHSESIELSGFDVPPARIVRQSQASITQ